MTHGHLLICHFWLLQLARDHLFQELVPPDPRPAARDDAGRRRRRVADGAAAEVRRRPPQEEPLVLRLLLLDRLLAQVRRCEVATSGDLGRPAAAATHRRVAVSSSRRAAGRLAG